MGHYPFGAFVVYPQLVGRIVSSRAGRSRRGQYSRPIICSLWRMIAIYVPTLVKGLSAAVCFAHAGRNVEMAPRLGAPRSSTSVLLRIGDHAWRLDSCLVRERFLRSLFPADGAFGIAVCGLGALGSVRTIARFHRAVEKQSDFAACRGVCSRDTRRLLRAGTPLSRAPMTAAEPR